MKYFFSLLFTVFFCIDAFCGDFPISRIYVELKDVPDGVNFYLLRGAKDTIEIVQSNKGIIDFKSRPLANGEMFFVCIDKKRTDLIGKNKNWIRLFLDGAVITLKGEVKDWPTLDVLGSKSTVVFQGYYSLVRPLVNSLDSISKNMLKEETKDSSLLKKMLSEYRRVELNFFKRNINVLSVPHLISLSYSATTADRRELWEEMDENVKRSYFGVMLGKEVESMKSLTSSRVELGRVIPDFKVETIDGNMVSVRGLVNKNKYTLIDFWAYWCGPCRDAVPSLKKTYEEFHNKGFNIISISIDANRPKWIKAVKELDTKWVNVLDLYKLSKSLFSVSAIPGYILLNERAEIIAMGVVGSKSNGVLPEYSSEKDFFLGERFTHQLMEKLLGKN